MEKINKYNYEAFFLDYIEGNLSADQQHDLFVFLAENPELKAEFVRMDHNVEGDFGDVILTPEEKTFDKKASLKVGDDSLLSLNNIDVWMIESVEGNLISSKEKELQEFVKKHKLEKTFATYHATILQPNREEIYADKKGLKVPAGIIIPLYVRFASIAAVGIILISVAFNNFGSGNNLPNNMASNNMAHSGNIAKISSPIIPDLNNNENINPDVNPNNNQYSNFAENNSDRRNNNQTNPDKFQEQNGTNNLISFQKEDEKKQDSTKFFINPLNEKNDDVVISVPDTLPTNSVIVESDDVASNTRRTEQPYKLITDLASNVTNREISFSRDKDLASNEYVGYQFKLGNIEFERKKSR